MVTEEKLLATPHLLHIRLFMELVQFQTYAVLKNKPPFPYPNIKWAAVFFLNLRVCKVLCVSDVYFCTAISLVHSDFYRFQKQFIAQIRKKSICRHYKQSYEEVMFNSCINLY